MIDLSYARSLANQLKAVNNDLTNAKRKLTSAQSCLDENNNIYQIVNSKIAEKRTD